MARKATKATPKKKSSVARTRKNSTARTRTRKNSTARTRTIDWKPAFLNNLSQDGVILEACRAAGINRATYYRHVKSEPEFAEQVDLALEDAGDVLEAEAVRRGTVGKSDTMLIFLLKGRKPEKYGERREVVGPGGGPLLFREVIAELTPEAGADDENAQPMAH